MAKKVEIYQQRASYMVVPTYKDEDGHYKQMEGKKVISDQCTDEELGILVREVFKRSKR